MPELIPGLQLSELYYHQAVRPILDRALPGLPHTAALIGFGSDVLGFDTSQSRDHGWGPRLILFLPEEGFAQQRERVDAALRRELPHSFRGYPTSFNRPDEIGVRLMDPTQSGPVDHYIEIINLRAYFGAYLGVDPFREPSIPGWLTFEEHKLLAVTAGKVFHDDLGLEAIRARLAYYPRELWLYLMAAQWMKLSQEEPFVARAGVVGDALGSQVIAARLVQALMRLAFLQERKYAPYSKWFGSAFSRLKSAQALKPVLEQALAARDWREREGHLSRAYTLAAESHNALGLTPPLPTETSWFHNRPYLVLHAETFAEALRAAIRDERVRALPPNVGSINQFVELTDVLESVELCLRLKGVYE